MFGRLLKGLEQRIERRRRKHVNLINDVDLEAGRGRDVLARFAQLPYLFDAVVAGAVYLENIKGADLGDFLGTLIVFIEIHLRTASAIKAFGEDAGNRGLAGAARPAEKVRMSDAFLLDGVGQRLGDVFLAHDLVETLWAVFSRNYLISHLFWIYDLRFTRQSLDCSFN